MSAVKRKGEISQQLCFEIEWTFQDIISHTTKDKYYHSPTFSVPGSEWYLRIYPNGQTKEDSVGCIGLYLMWESDDSTTPKSVNYDLGVKKVDGTIEVIKRDTSHVFDRNSSGWGFPTFLQRSQLQKRKLELVSHGALIVTCTMRIKDAWDCTSRLMELSEDFKRMFTSKKDCDATLIVKGAGFPVHKSVLASRSVVFETMFESDLKEKKTKILNVNDCYSSSFKDFLVYIYSGKFENSSGNVPELYKIAIKHHVDDLKSACVHFMSNNLSINNVLDVFVLGHHFDEPELKSKAQEFFKRNAADILPTTRWSSLMKTNLTLANELLITMAMDMKSKEMEDRLLRNLC